MDARQANGALSMRPRAPGRSKCPRFGRNPAEGLVSRSQGREHPRPRASRPAGHAPSLGNDAPGVGRAAAGASRNIGLTVGPGNTDDLFREAEQLSQRPPSADAAMQSELDPVAPDQSAASKAKVRPALRLVAAPIRSSGSFAYAITPPTELSDRRPPTTFEQHIQGFC